MSLLRKLAGLVVEFPAAQQPPAAGGDEDVVAAIEKVRAEMESELKPKFESALSEAEAQSRPHDAPPGGDAISTLPLLSVEEIYQHAGLAPDPQGFDIYKIEAMLADPETADLAVEMRARMVKMTLKNMGRDLRDVLTDAARRDQALDEFLTFLRNKVGAIGEQVAAANARHTQERDAFVAAKNAAIQANLASEKAAQHALADFVRTKQAEEERLFKTVAPFVAPGENPVVISEPPATGHPAAGGGKTVKEEPKP